MAFIILKPLLHTSMKVSKPVNESALGLFEINDAFIWAGAGAGTFAKIKTHYFSKCNRPTDQPTEK